MPWHSRRPPPASPPSEPVRRQGLRSAMVCAMASALLLGTAWASAADPAAAPSRGGSGGPPSSADCTAGSHWPLWQTFAERHIQPDGRVVDHAAQRLHSTSEGQSYAMLFALVANDRTRFDQIWRWSVDNLSAKTQLPVWQWGRRDDGSWGVVDDNSASDADLWFAYALAEAGRLWNAPQYTRDALALLPLITQGEVAQLPGLGAMLLPGRSGFATVPNQWRLNPSYLPLPVLRRLAGLQPAGPWDAIARNTVKMLARSTPKGLAPDWVLYKVEMPAEGSGFTAATGTFQVDSATADLGSYEAIRVYLWAGMTARGDDLAAPLLKTLGGMAQALKTSGVPPEKVRTLSATTSGAAPVGFSAALLPYLRASGHADLLATQRARAQAGLWTSAPQPLPTYYDYVLGLFGTGWDEQRYQFLPSGKLKLRTEKVCLPNAKKP